jgi:hypothetical protein
VRSQRRRAYSSTGRVEVAVLPLGWFVLECLYDSQSFAANCSCSISSAAVLDFIAKSCSKIKRILGGRFCSN